MDSVTNSSVSNSPQTAASFNGNLERNVELFYANNGIANKATYAKP